MIRLVACTARRLTLALPARAALDIGERAPDFTTSAARGGDGLQVLAGRRAQEGPGRTVLLPGRLFRGLLGRGARLRRGDPAIRGARAPRWSACPATTSTRCPSSRSRRARASFRWPPTSTQAVMKSYDAVLQDAARVREPHLLRHRARRLRRLPLHEPQPDQARREDARRAAHVVGDQEIALPIGAVKSRSSSPVRSPAPTGY